MKSEKNIDIRHMFIYHSSWSEFRSFSSLYIFATMSSLTEIAVSLKIRISVDPGLARWQMQYISSSYRQQCSRLRYSYIENKVTNFYRGDCYSWERNVKILVLYPIYVIFHNKFWFFLFPNSNIIIENSRCFIKILIKVLVLLVFLMFCSYLFR